MLKAGTVLERNIEAFHEEFSESLLALMSDLNEAGISHYSSGCGVKNVTFDIFPASAYVAELLEMVSLKRAYRTKAQWGFKDAASTNNYNPAHDFIHYLRRWSLFAQQVMQNEGIASRGVAAARAKLTMEDLITRFSRDSSGKPNVKSLPKANDFSRLMRDIGLELERGEKSDETQREIDERKMEEENYRQALAAAQGTDPDSMEEKPPLSAMQAA